MEYTLHDNGRKINWSNLFDDQHCRLPEFEDLDDCPFLFCLEFKRSNGLVYPFVLTETDNKYTYHLFKLLSERPDLFKYVFHLYTLWVYSTGRVEEIIMDDDDTQFIYEFSDCLNTISKDVLRFLLTEASDEVCEASCECTAKIVEKLPFSVYQNSWDDQTKRTTASVN